LSKCTDPGSNTLPLRALLGVILGLILCPKNKILGVESHDFSQADKEISACKVEEIQKMTSIFTQNDNQGPF
jgi:hypothetical protein